MKDTEGAVVTLILIVFHFQSDTQSTGTGSLKLNTYKYINNLHDYILPDNFYPSLICPIKSNTTDISSIVF